MFESVGGDRDLGEVITDLGANLLSPPSAEFVYGWDLWITAGIFGSPVILICYVISFVLRDDVLETRLVFDSVGEMLLIKSLQISVFALRSMFWDG